MSVLRKQEVRLKFRCAVLRPKCKIYPFSDSGQMMFFRRFTTDEFKLTIEDSFRSAMHHNTVLASEVIIKAQYSIVSKQSMIQELVLWYLKLKPKPRSMFIYNTLVESSLVNKDTQTSNNSDVKKKEKKSKKFEPLS